MASYKYLLLLPLAASTAWAVPVSVQINDSAGNPVAGVLVEAQTFGPAGVTFLDKTTGPTGQVTFEASPIPDQPDYMGRFNAWKKGYALAGGLLKRSGVKVGLTRGTSLSGSIVDAAQKPVAGAIVSLSSARVTDKDWLYYGGHKKQIAISQQFQTKTDAQGHFQFEDLPANSQVELVTNDPRFTRETASSRAGGAALQLTVRPAATLKGTLLDAAGKPVAKVNLFAMGQGEGRVTRADAVTDSQGNYVFSSLPTGTYRITLGPDNQSNLIIVPATAKAVEAQTTEVPTLRAQAGTLVSGLVRNKVTRQPVPRAVVQITGPTAGIETFGFTNAQGRWQASVLPGTIKVSLEQPPKEFLRTSSQNRSVVVPSSGAEGLNFDLTPATKITGRVVDEKGQGVKAALVLSQGYQEWAFQSNENGEFTAYGPTKGELKIGPSTWDEEAPRWEVVRADKLTLPSQNPLNVVVRPMSFNLIEGNVVDEVGKPVPGAQVTLKITTGSGESQVTRSVGIPADAQGHFRYEKLRPDQRVEANASKEHYDFVRGGQTTKRDGQWTVAPLVLRQRNARIAGRVVNSQGQGIEGAQVYAAGVETRSLANGEFVLQNLPSAEVDVVAYGGEEFGLVRGATKGDVELILAPVTLQKQDVELAQSILDEARTEAENTQYYAKNALKLRWDGNFETRFDAIKAQTSGQRDDALLGLIYRYMARTEVPTSSLLEALTLMKNPSKQLYIAAMVWNRRPGWPDNEATRQLVEQIEVQAAEQAKVNDNNDWERIIGLFGVAPLIEAYEGPKAGDLAFENAYAWTLKNSPAKESGNRASRDQTLQVVADLLATNSPRLFEQVLEAISEPTAPAYAQTLQEGTIAIAKSQGFKAALPYLERLRKAPPPQADDDNNVASLDALYATALRRSIAEGKNDAPQEALRLAQLLPVDPRDSSEVGQPRAVAEAAFALPLDQARPLWQAALAKLDPGMAASYAVRILPLDQELAKEILGVAVTRLENKSRYNLWMTENVLPTLAFYEADINPARARYRLEKAWNGSQAETYNNDREKRVRAMAKIDAKRAYEWAKRIPTRDDNGFSSLNARRKVAQWLEADATARQAVIFDRWDRTDLWDANKQEL